MVGAAVFVPGKEARWSRPIGSHSAKALNFGWKSDGLSGRLNIGLACSAERGVLVPVSDASFETVAIGDLDGMTADERDALPYGVVGFDADTIVTIYNATEARMSGLDPSTVLGVPFFEAVGQCMNNFMVAQRFEDEAAIDDIIPYVLTLRMRPTKVRLRLLADPDGPHHYILIER